MGRPRCQVGFLSFDGIEILDVVGPWEVFGHANEVLGYEAFELALLAASTRTIDTRHGLTLGNAQRLAARRGPPPELLVVPGGSPLREPSSSQSAVVRWLKRHAHSSTVISVCTGAFVLGQAGLLDGRRVTTHWRFLQTLQDRFRKAHVVDEGIFIDDGPVWTSAGVTAGIDLALALVERRHGREVALAVAKELVLFLRRSGHQAQFSTTLMRQHQEPNRLHRLSEYVLDHLDEPVGVERLARALGMSARSLSRWCREHMGAPPAEIVRRVRLDEACRLIETTDVPLKVIAANTGLGDTSTLWRVFIRHLGVTPAEYRERFSSTSPRHAQRQRRGPRN